MTEKIKNSTRRTTIKKLSFEDPKGNLMWCILIIIGLMGVFSFLVNFVFLKFGYSFDISFINKMITFLPMILMVPIFLGFISVLLKNSRDEIYTISDMFGEIKNSFKYVLLYIIVMFGYFLLYTLIGLIPVVGFFINLLIFILFMPVYFILPFVYLDNKHLKIKEIIFKSLDIISGRRVEFYAMICSFAGWFAVGICTAGFLFIWIIPYLYIAYTYLYLSWTHEKEFEKSKGITDGFMILITLAITLILGIIMVVNVPSTVDNIKSMIFGVKNESTKGGNQLSYGGAKITFDDPEGYDLASDTDTTKTYSNDKNYNILQYTVYLSSVDDAIKLDKETVSEMRATDKYKEIGEEEFSFKASGKNVKGYLYKVTAKDNKKSAIAIAYYPVDGYVVTVSLSNSHDGNIDKNELKKFVKIY